MRQAPVTESAIGFPKALAEVESALSEAHWDSLSLGGAHAAPVLRQEPYVRIFPYPRMTIVRRGKIRHVLSQRGERAEVMAKTGSVIHFATHAWDVQDWSGSVAFLGLVFRREYLRVLWCDHVGGGHPSAHARIAYHTQAPLSGAAVSTLAALDALADARPTASTQATAGDLGRALLRLARDHLAHDLAGAVAGSGSLRSWQDAREYLEEHLSEEISRDRVAGVLGIHPNYLSQLFSCHGGHSFQRTLEGLRLERARGILTREPDVPVNEIAVRCGFGSANYFTRVFHRRLGVTPARWRHGRDA